MPPPVDDLTTQAAADVLGRLVPGADVALPASGIAALEQLVRAGYVAPSADAQAGRAELAAKKAALAATGTDAVAATRLRHEILALSESLATADGAATVRSLHADGGPYRGSAGGTALGTFVLTQAGRALVSNLVPRAQRAPDLPLSRFAAQLAALDGVFAMRAQRAAAMVERVGPKTEPLLPTHALRSAMLGLASLPHGVEALADAFVVLYTGIRQSHATMAFSPAQNASAAEAYLLHAGDPRYAYESTTASGLVAMRDDVGARHCQGRPEDALDAMLLLVAIPEASRESAIARAAAFAIAMTRANVPTPLSLALLATIGRDDALVPPAVAAYRHVLPRSADPLEALATSILATLQRSHSIEAQLARIDALHAYLMRTAPSMLVAAAMLALLDGDPAGILDDLRLAARQITEQRLAPGGAEATALGVKLLLHSALLARGQEGDPEEQVALAMRALPWLAALELGHQGLGTASAVLPLLATSVTAFHRPMLDAAVIYAQHSTPMHSDYVFGGYTGGSRSYGTTHHRSFGWG